ncbi:amidohydrolase family protein [Phenylobacterium sp.]|uniref:amidohydrolase family protein n=1 Tax=Phenylobacterium sp. TaxID=1871053 RepID=UPI00301DBCFF
MSLILRNVEVEGRAGLDVRIEAGRIAAVGECLPRARDEIDGRGGALIPGLWDHHIHILALAARDASLDLSDVDDPGELARRIAGATAARPTGRWLRAIGWHEAQMGDLDRATLDRLAPDQPVRVQHQTGALWALNSRALDALPAGDDPAGLDRAAGHLWRGDAWLRAKLGSDPPPLAPLGARLAAMGVTGLTDASVTTDATAAARLAGAHRVGDLPQRLCLMSGGPLAAKDDGAYAVGPVKVLLDDADLIDLDDFIQRMATARASGRAVAVHCVTAAELALTLAAFATAGARPGDRIEHGSVIPADAIPTLRDLGLTVVSQPAFVRERGDRYLRETDPADRGDLYRLASLRAAGVPLAASSDAPYAAPDPWAGIAAARDRRTAGGRALGPAEALPARAALELYLGSASCPGGKARRLSAGAMADLVLLDGPLRRVLSAPSAEAVRMTLIGGRAVHGA